MVHMSAPVYIQHLASSKESLVKEFRLLRGSISLYYIRTYSTGVRAVGI